ncbi:hypothetical protein ACX6XY_11830 [Streptomyces sp. O3]
MLIPVLAVGGIWLWFYRQDRAAERNKQTAIERIQDMPRPYARDLVDWTARNDYPGKERTTRIVREYGTDSRTVSYTRTDGESLVIVTSFAEEYEDSGSLWRGPSTSLVSRCYLTVVYKTGRKPEAVTTPLDTCDVDAVRP